MFSHFLGSGGGGSGGGGGGGGSSKNGGGKQSTLIGYFGKGKGKKKYRG